MLNPKKLEYFKSIVTTVASKATCDRAKVGCIIINDDYIISTGYNGAPRGEIHCDDNDHLMKDGHCIRTIHAEVNAIINAAKNGINIKDCDMICVYKPCFRCMQVLINSGIKNVYYFEDYKDEFQKYFEENKFVKFIKCKK